MSELTAIDTTPLFPRAVSTFVGRTAEVARVLDLLDRETLFTVYGVGGIGKSELLYKVVEEARKLPRWRHATPVLIEVKPHLDVDSVLAVLRGRISEQDLCAHRPELADSLEDLSLRFLVDTDRGAVSVHNLVRDALMHRRPEPAA